MKKPNSSPIVQIFKRIYSDGSYYDSFEKEPFEKLSSEERKKILNALKESFSYLNQKVSIDKNALTDSVKSLKDIAENHNLSIERLNKYRVILVAKSRVHYFYNYYDQSKKNSVYRRIDSKGFSLLFGKNRTLFPQAENRIYHLTYAEALALLDADEIIVRRISADLNKCFSSFK